MSAAQILPIGLAFVMLGLGLSLTPDDFKRVLGQPRAVIVGLAVQMFLLPAIAFALCKIFALSPEYSVGLMILAGSPGGILANLFSHLAHGDVALNITLTAINSLLSAVTLPLMVGLSLHFFHDSEQGIGLQFRKSIEFFAIVLIPVIVGMGVRRRKPELAQRADRPIRIFAGLLLAGLIFAAITQEREVLAQTFGQLGVAMLVFNLLSLYIGYQVPALLKLSERHSISISMEVGIHNATIAIYIGMVILGNTAYALPAAIYGIIMSFTASAFAVYLGKRRKVV